MNYNGKLNAQRLTAHKALGSNTPLSVQPKKASGANPQMSVRPEVASTRSPQPRTITPQPTGGRRLQRGYGVSASKLQGAPLEGRSLNGRKVQ